MATVIKSATAAQLDEIDRIRQFWIDDQTTQFTREDISGVVNRMWAAMGEKPPVTIVLASPLAAMIGAALTSQIDSLRGQLYRQLHSLDSQLHSQLGSQLHSQLGSLHSQLGSQLHSQLYSLDSQLDSQLESQLHSLHSQLDSLRGQLDSQLYSLGSQLYSQLYSQLRSQLYSLDRQLHSQLGSLHSQLHSQLDSLRGQLNGQRWYMTMFWRSLAGSYQGGEVLGVKFDREKLSLFTDFTRRVPLIVPYKGLAVVSSNPVRVSWLAGELHRDGGPAVEFSDGYSLFALNGIAVPRWLAEEKAESLDPLKILAEANVEVRRAGVRKIGVERLMFKAGAKRIDATGDYELLSVPLGERVTGVALKMLNPSVPECWHVEFVDPKCQTVQQALNFRNHLTPAMIDDVNGAEFYQQGDVILRPRGAKKFKSRPIVLT